VLVVVQQADADLLHVSGTDVMIFNIVLQKIGEK
jgi:hypothetical protein